MVQTNRNGGITYFPEGIWTGSSFARLQKMSDIRKEGLIQSLSFYGSQAMG